MAFYLIDFENTKNIVQIDALTENDVIVFFYSQNANVMSFDLHIALNESPVKKEYFMVRCGGKNALDFQLSSYVGYLISKHPEEEIHIISQDKGFEYLVPFWNEHGYSHLSVGRSICEGENGANDCADTDVDSDAEVDAYLAAEPTETVKKTTAETLHEVLRKNAAVLKLSTEQCKQIEAIVNGYKTKQAINNNLMKLFRDSDKVGKITKIIKPFLKSKK